MTAQELYKLLRATTEDDVLRVMPRLLEEGAEIEGSTVDLLEFFHHMLDELLGDRAAWKDVDDQNVVDTAERRRKQH